MARRSRIVTPLLVLACASSTAWASKKVFNIYDDLLAYPQYQVLFPDGYLLESHARELLYSQQDEHVEYNAFDNEPTYVGQNQAQVALNGGAHGSKGGRLRREEGDLVTYEEMDLEGQRYLCRIPHVEREDQSKSNGTQESNEAEEKRELARATDRGMELLREMEGKCMYYVSGWWSYSFCYMNQVKQFHALPSGSGIPSYPPMEDPTTHSFILGRFPRSVGGDEGTEETESKKTTTALAELQTKGGSRYLVQRLDGGTRCDLTGRNRKIEVQFHCHPQSTDRIGWIKEPTTCSYLMVIYTPRLCNDVAFLPPQQEQVHSIECREILTPDEVPEWEAMQEYHHSQRLVEAAETLEFPIVGDILVGAQKLVGTEGKVIEKGRVASAGEEKVDTLAKRENGQIQRLSREELKKYDLDPEKVEELKRQMEEWAKGKDWTLEVVLANGERGLRGIVDTDSEQTETADKTGKPQAQAKSAEQAGQQGATGERQKTASGDGQGSTEQNLEGETGESEDDELQMEQFYMVI
ncbi:Protein OS-9 [Aspergillus melleus]|uniref:Protein OS-9 n=1 Tax=Aspergillus melleus TaxID=138277 RepID=UPI001E8D79D8|nr:Protein OS-9 [Aspergillus melleus]KAH8433671.1 Protein OS-9 [Aspergillus melleus]